MIDNWRHDTVTYNRLTFIYSVSPIVTQSKLFNYLNDESGRVRIIIIFMYTIK